MSSSYSSGFHGNCTDPSASPSTSGAGSVYQGHHHQAEISSSSDPPAIDYQFVQPPPLPDFIPAKMIEDFDKCMSDDMMLTDTAQPPQLPDIVPSKVVEEFEKIMSNENDKVVLTNSVCLLFRFSIDSARGLEVCQAMSASPDIMNRLYYVLMNEQFKDDDLILCYATGNLTNISKYEVGRAVILGLNYPQSSDHYLYKPSLGVESLFCSLQSRDSNVVIFAITAIHNLLLDRELQEITKEQIKHGIQYIVQLLDNQSLIHNYEFKVIVLDCLLILAYGNKDNRLAIKRSGGPFLILRTIRENFDDQPTEELIDTASRVLKSLSACPENKLDIIDNDGIEVLTNCIGRGNREILKTCIWTLRNLSDLINNSERNHGQCISQLVGRILQILDDYVNEPCIIACALGILANMTCNNDAVKQLICSCNGVDLLFNTIAFTSKDGRDFKIVDKEIVEPAVCTLCHLMNQSNNPDLAEKVKASVRNKWSEMFRPFKIFMVVSELSKALDKLFNLAYDNFAGLTIV